MAELPISPHPLQLLSGAETFLGLDASVGDFWRWAFNDLRDNTTRGALAEFLVARALGDPSERRVVWANRYDSGGHPRRGQEQWPAAACVLPLDRARLGL